MPLLCEAWPERLRYDEILEQAQASLRNPMPTATEMLSELLMKMYGAGLMEIDTSPWPYPATCKERPCVSQLARFQAKKAQGDFSASPGIDLDDDSRAAS